MPDRLHLVREAIEHVAVECDEDGTHLILEGDFTNTFADYLAAPPSSPASGRVQIRLTQDAMFALAAAVRTSGLDQWVADYDAHLAAYRAASPEERAAVLEGGR